MELYYTEYNSRLILKYGLTVSDSEDSGQWLLTFFAMK